MNDFDNDYLKKARIEHNLTQCELATMLDTTQATVGMVESGKRVPSLKLLKKIASVLNLNLNKLLKLKES